jgi:hypothetical protein
MLQARQTEIQYQHLDVSEAALLFLGFPYSLKHVCKTRGYLASIANGMTVRLEQSAKSLLLTVYGRLVLCEA